MLPLPLTPYPCENEKLNKKNPRSLNLPLVLILVGVISTQFPHGRLNHTTSELFWFAFRLDLWNTINGVNSNRRNQTFRAAKLHKSRLECKANTHHGRSHGNRWVLWLKRTSPVADIIPCPSCHGSSTDRNGKRGSKKGRSGGRFSFSSCKAEVGSGGCWPLLGFLFSTVPVGINSKSTDTGVCRRLLKIKPEKQKPKKICPDPAGSGEDEESPGSDEDKTETEVTPLSSDMMSSSKKKSGAIVDTSAATMVRRLRSGGVRLPLSPPPSSETKKSLSLKRKRVDDSPTSHVAKKAEPKDLLDTFGDTLLPSVKMNFQALTPDAAFSHVGATLRVAFQEPMPTNARCQEEMRALE